MSAAGLFAVFVGGGTGSVLRYALGQGVAKWTAGWPLGTLAANLIATLVLVSAWRWMPESIEEGRFPAHLLVMTGFCGGFSTFSTFSLDTVRLYIDHGPWAAAVNVAINVVGCVAIAAGFMGRVA